MWQLENMSFQARGAKRDADGTIRELAGGAGTRVYSMMSREEAEAEAGRAVERAAGAVGGNKHRKKEERPSLYAAQKPMSAKQKYRKGTSNPGAWR